METEKLKKILNDHELYLLTEGLDGVIADLRHANLSKANLSERNLSHANLSGANLVSAILHDTDLSYSDLRCADLRHASMIQANLRHADLSGADLRHASMIRANLSGAKIDLRIEDGLFRKVVMKILAEIWLFDNLSWHNYCETTHCIAGHGVIMAKNKDLENEYGTEMAGLLLLGVEAHSHFFDSTQSAIRWLDYVAKTRK